MADARVKVVNVRMKDGSSPDSAMPDDYGPRSSVTQELKEFRKDAKAKSKAEKIMLKEASAAAKAQTDFMNGESKQQKLDTQIAREKAANLLGVATARASEDKQREKSDEAAAKVIVAREQKNIAARDKRLKEKEKRDAADIVAKQKLEDAETAESILINRTMAGIAETAKKNIDAGAKRESARVEKNQKLREKRAADKIKHDKSVADKNFKDNKFLNDIRDAAEANAIASAKEDVRKQKSALAEAKRLAKEQEKKEREDSFKHDEPYDFEKKKRSSSILGKMMLGGAATSGAGRMLIRSNIEHYLRAPDEQREHMASNSPMLKAMLGSTPLPARPVGPLNDQERAKFDLKDRRAQLKHLEKIAHDMGQVNREVRQSNRLLGSVASGLGGILRWSHPDSIKDRAQMGSNTGEKAAWAGGLLGLSGVVNRNNTHNIFGNAYNSIVPDSIKGVINPMADKAEGFLGINNGNRKTISSVLGLGAIGSAAGLNPLIGNSGSMLGGAGSAAGGILGMGGSLAGGLMGAGSEALGGASIAGGPMGMLIGALPGLTADLMKLGGAVGAMAEAYRVFSSDKPFETLKGDIGTAGEAITGFASKIGGAYSSLSNSPVGQAMGLPQAAGSEGSKKGIMERLGDTIKSSAKATFNPDGESNISKDGKAIWNWLTAPDPSSAIHYGRTKDDDVRKDSKPSIFGGLDPTAIKKYEEDHNHSESTLTSIAKKITNIFTSNNNKKNDSVQAREDNVYRKYITMTRDLRKEAKSTIVIQDNKQITQAAPAPQQQSTGPSMPAPPARNRDRHDDVQYGKIPGYGY